MAKCPICETESVSGELKEYETLVDHVWDPNQPTYPKRPTLECPNKECKAHGAGFWSSCEGGWYSNMNSFGLNIPDIKVYS